MGSDGETKARGEQTPFFILFIERGESGLGEVSRKVRKGLTGRHTRGGN